MLERDVLLPLIEPALFAKYKLSPPNGILFYGPPGCGKTHIARALARKAGRTFMEIKPSDLGSIYIHGSQGKIRALFDKAVEKSPCLLFFDELDALVPMRGHAGGYQDNEVNAADEAMVEATTLPIDVWDHTDVRRSAPAEPANDKDCNLRSYLK